MVQILSSPIAPIDLIKLYIGPAVSLPHCPLALTSSQTHTSFHSLATACTQPYLSTYLDSSLPFQSFSNYNCNGKVICQQPQRGNVSSLLNVQMFLKQPSCSQQYGVNEAPDGRDLWSHDPSKNPSANARTSVPVDPNKDPQD